MNNLIFISVPPNLKHLKTKLVFVQCSKYVASNNRWFKCSIYFHLILKEQILKEYYLSIAMP